jgi:hypothetical protein
VSRVRPVHLLAPFLVLAIAVAVRFPTLRQPLIEAHAFRQTQTAFTARIFHESGIHLMRPEVPVLGEPWTIPFEFPLYQAIATIPMNLGVGTDAALRLTGLAFFVLTAAMLWLLVRRVTGDLFAAFATVVFFCFSPFSLLWGRTSLMEFLATAGGVAMVYFAVVWWDDRRLRWAALASASALLALLVKSTTGAFYVIPIAGWIVVRAKEQGAAGIRDRVRALFHPGLVAILAPAFVATLLWNRHADAVKAATASTKWLVSGALNDWTFGTIAQRLQVANWVTVFDRMEQLLVGRYLFWALILAGLVLTSRKWFWAAMAATVVLPVAVFFNLYVVHDYYLSAISPAIAALLGNGAGELARRVRWRQFAVPVGLAVLAGWLLVSLTTTKPYWLAAYRKVEPSARRFPLATEIDEHTKATDRVVVLGLDWDPTWLYQAERRGAMLVDDTKTKYPTGDFLAELRRRGYEAFVVSDPAVQPIALSTTWPWVGSVSPHVYRLGESAAKLGPAPLVGTSDVAAFDRVAPSGHVVASDVTVPCATGIDLRRGVGALWLRLANPDTAVRMSIGGEIAPMPATPVLIIDPAQEVAHLACSGTGAVTIATILDGPRLGDIR